MEFFQLSAGKWQSQRTTHHLPFRRSETGDSEIWVETFPADHPQVVDICNLHQVAPNLAVGGAFVSWHGSMAWDREGDEDHEGSTVFALVPDDPDNPRQGQLLRERGYAEIVPVAGRYHMDDQDGLVLTTEYESMSSVERFWFVAPNLRLRSSTVKRFGGFSTASFCTELRIQDTSETISKLNSTDASDAIPTQTQDTTDAKAYYSTFGW